MLEDYQKARRMGLKQVDRAVAAGRYPYPPALDDILKNRGYQGEVAIGTAEIDLSLIAGTRTRGRQNVFSAEFMPLPEPDSEFAGKWIRLIDHQCEQGVTDPIVVYEYLQRFYVQEGNKRVSVMRYLGAACIPARITRVVPMPSDEPAVRAYRAFMRFYRVAPVYGIVCSREEGYARLASLVGCDLEERWPDDLVRRLSSAFGRFAAAFNRRDGAALQLPVGDAFLIYLRIYGFDRVCDLSTAQVDDHVEGIWGEFVVSSGDRAIAYLESPQPAPTKPLRNIRTIYQSLLPARPFRVAFLYDRRPQTSGWVAQHEKGRIELEMRMGAEVETAAFAGTSSDDAFDRAIDGAVAREADLIVTVAPTQMAQTLRAAASNPERAFLNCSVSLSHSVVRTFSCRLYEVKFLLGALAASLADNHLVGYVGRAPVYGSAAEINAFALGAAMVDPRVRVHLRWFSADGDGWRREFAEAGVRVVSARDYPNPVDAGETWGLYTVGGDGSEERVAEPVWEWGRYYELIVRSIRDDAWRREGDVLRGQALNYWWGMSEGIVDVRLSRALPVGQRRLVEVLRQSVLSGRISPFSGALRRQGGAVVQEEGAERLPSDDIARMSWLNENVVGRLPPARELDPAGLEEVRVSGLLPEDPLPGAPASAAGDGGPAASSVVGGAR